MDEFIEQGSKLYDSETLAWNRGDVLGIASAQQAQRDLETELFSSSEPEKKSTSMFSRVMKPVLAGTSMVLGAIAGVVYDGKVGSELSDDPIDYSVSEGEILYSEDFNDLDAEGLLAFQRNAGGYYYGDGTESVGWRTEHYATVHDSINPYLTLRKEEGWDPAVFWYDGGYNWIEYSVKFNMNIEEHGVDCVSAECIDDTSSEWGLWKDNAFRIIIGGERIESSWRDPDEILDSNYELYFDQGDRIILFKNANNVRAKLGEIDYPFEEGTWQEVQINYSFDEFSMSVNDTKVLQYLINDRATILRGTFGFATEGWGALEYHFDDFEVRNRTLEEVVVPPPIEESTDLSIIQETTNESSSDNVTLNRSELSALLYKIIELEDRMSERDDALNQSNQNLAEVRQDWATDNETGSEAVEVSASESSDGTTNYGFWVGTAAATLTLGGFLLQNRQLRSLKQRTIDPVSNLLGFDSDESSLIRLPREVVRMDEQGNVVVHVHGDQYNTMMQAARESDVDAYFGGIESAKKS